MIQEILLILIFVAALAYLGKLLYEHFVPKNGFCSKGCGSCGAIDFKKLEKQIEQAKKQHT